ncbi:MAG TPA: PBP1A family penicillin-binding protein [Bryobacteraceae bacterium]|nr:PBP1A family penicillin-binding protein [Bryobacteraceae bacterium]
MKVRVPKNSAMAQFILGPVGRILLACAAVATVMGMVAFTMVYVKYSRLIDQKLSAGPFTNTSKIYSAPRSVSVGDQSTPDQIAAELRRSGYNESRGNPIGYFLLHGDSIEIFPGPESYFDQEAGLIRFANGRISQIISLDDNTSRGAYQLEPQLITNLFDRNREKRRLVRFQDIPKVLVDAVTSAEDKRFFQHAGFDPIRIVKAAYVDLKEGRKEQGASTLSQQLARSFWLDLDKRWTRKLAEMVITMQLEQKLTKEQIFEDYANQIYLGWRGSFRIHGFGEAAEAYFGKDLSQITLPQAATLAGMIQRPSYFNPFKHPDRMRDRRNIVLSLMRQNGFVSDRDYAIATEAPLVLAKATAESADAPYFVDLVNDTLQSKFQDYDFQSNAFRIYTTLDMNLQRAAVEAIRNGMQNVDEQIRKQRRFRGQPVPEAQVALVAIDPHTGEIKALCGGRNYGVSQLNHVLAKRQPGSIFKPFVYATALNTGVEGGPHILTASTTVDDDPTTFWFDGKPYEPSNFKHEFYGTVTLRQALAHSLNVATVKVAEAVGYNNVVEMANRAGMNYKIQPTPAVALGAYEITPLEAAGAYTIFANHGEYVKPSFLTMVRSSDGKVIYKNEPVRHQVLDPRVAYLTTNLMEEVMRTGTAAGVRARGFTVPAAGKTGTSHDGWFAGYTSELLCIVWVGFDDNRELDLEGAHSALPIWTDFMKRALDYREYRDARPFTVPDGVVTIDIDPASGMPATPNCPEVRPEVYIAGTQPVGTCPLHGGHQNVTNVAGWQITEPAGQPQPQQHQQAAPPVGTTLHITGSGNDGVVSSSAPHHSATGETAADPSQAAERQAQEQQQKEKPPKKGIFHRLWGVFK